MVQWSVDWWVSIGIHIDLRARVTPSGERYGPYVDLHLLFLVLSFGVNPVRSGELDLKASCGRGGLGDGHFY